MGEKRPSVFKLKKSISRSCSADVIEYFDPNSELLKKKRYQAEAE
jgi:hypothetical protein